MKKRELFQPYFTKFEMPDDGPAHEKMVFVTTIFLLFLTFTGMYFILQRPYDQTVQIAKDNLDREMNTLLKVRTTFETSRPKTNIIYE